jgi:hypothetical protein
VPALAAVLAGCGGGSDGSGPEAPGEVEVLDLRCEAAPEPVSLRRLTRFEMENAISDALGVTVDLSGLPPDEESYGFENQADTITVTDLHVDGQLRLAEAVIETLAGDRSKLAALSPCEETESGCAAQFVEHWGRRLMRRELNDDEREKLSALFEEPGMSFTEAAAGVLGALLLSPDFLYRVERAAGEDGLASPWVLASRLSFLLWGAGPDDELLDAAAAGALASPADVLSQAQRMLEDPRSKRGLSHFYEYWLGLSHLDFVDKDRRLFPRWTDEMRDLLRGETRHFVEGVIWEEGAKLSTLLGATFTYATPLVADFYGMTPVSNDSKRFVKTDLPREQERRGILSQGAILSRLSTANQSSPIHRGKFVRTQLFCTIPAPPPPDLVVFPPALDAANRVTTRERFAAHRENPACNTCHELLDPVGFGFEHFDATGRYREHEGTNEIDDSGYLVGTDVDGAFDGLSGLSEKLLASAQVKRCVATQWFRYAFGRGETAGDTCTLDKLEDVFVRSGGDLKLLMLALTQTTPFLAPSPEPAAEDEP